MYLDFIKRFVYLLLHIWQNNQKDAYLQVTMKKCPSCGKKNQKAALQCRFCGAALAQPDASFANALADAEIKLKTLILDFPSYARQLLEFFKAPRRYFFQRDYPDDPNVKLSLACMLQGIALSFVIFTVGWVAPQSLAGFGAVNVPLLYGSREELGDYAKRVNEVKRLLPPSLVEAWFEQSELMLAVRILPEDKFQRLRERLRELSAQEPRLLEDAIKGAWTFGNRLGGRGYIVSFFLAIHPQTIALRQQLPFELANIGPKYKLQPHVDFLLRTIILWGVACYIIARFISAPSRDKKSIFVIGAYLLGFLYPLFQACLALRNVYFAMTLPVYIQKAGLLLTNAAVSPLDKLSSGVFPFENLLIVVFNVAVHGLIIGIGMSAFVSGLERAYQVSAKQAWVVVGIGFGIGLGAAESVSHLITLILAPTGLL
jgi:hypothetical protein